MKDRSENCSRIDRLHLYMGLFIPHDLSVAYRELKICNQNVYFEYIVFKMKTDLRS